MGESKNTFNTTFKKMGRLDKMIVFNMLIIVVMLVCVFRDALWQELGWPFFLEGICVELPILWLWRTCPNLPHFSHTIKEFYIVHLSSMTLLLQTLTSQVFHNLRSSIPFTDLNDSKTLLFISSEFCR
jgi:hypothetical protein